MRRTLVPLLAVLITLCQPMPADAMWWAWLEKWSGPGPFKARPFRTFLFTACAQEVRNTPAPFPQPAKRLALRPSPIARTDAFHQQQEAIARLMAANNPDKADPATKDDFYARLLANPVTPLSLGFIPANGFDSVYEAVLTVMLVVCTMGTPSITHRG